MTDLYISPDTGDLAIVDGDLIAVGTEEDLTRQAVVMSLKAFKGEWFRNVGYGTPWIENEDNKLSLLGKTNKPFIDSQIRLVIKSLPEVVSIESYSTVFNDASGEMLISVGVVSKSGDLILVNESFTVI